MTASSTAVVALFAPSSTPTSPISTSRPWQKSLFQDYDTLILSYLNQFPEILRLCTVCKAWNKLVQQAQTIWKSVTLSHSLSEQDLLVFLKTYGPLIQALRFNVEIPDRNHHLFYLRIPHLVPKLKGLDLSGVYGLPRNVFLGFQQKHRNVLIQHDQVDWTFQRLCRWVRKQLEGRQNNNIQPSENTDQNTLTTLNMFVGKQNPVDAERWLGARGFMHFLSDVGLPDSSQYVLDVFVKGSRVDLQWATNFTGLTSGTVVCIR